MWKLYRRSRYNYLVHDPALAVVRSAFWHLKNVSGLWRRIDFDILGVKIKVLEFHKTTFFLHIICSTLAFFLPWSQLTCLAALHNLARKTLGWHDPRSFRRMNCWTNFFSSGCSFTWLWQPRCLGKLLGMNFFKDSHPRSAISVPATLDMFWLLPLRIFFVHSLFSKNLFEA